MIAEASNGCRLARVSVAVVHTVSACRGPCRGCLIPGLRLKRHRGACLEDVRDELPAKRHVNDVAPSQLHGSRVLLLSVRPEHHATLSRDGIVSLILMAVEFGCGTAEVPVGVDDPELTRGCRTPAISVLRSRCLLLLR